MDILNVAGVSSATRCLFRADHGNGIEAHPRVRHGRRRSSKIPLTCSWPVRIDPRAEPYIQHDLLQGSIVFPGVGHMEIALAAAIQAYGEGSFELEDVRLSNALFLAERQPLPEVA